MTRLEHVNVTVRDCVATATVLCGLFGWHIRWQGRAKNDGWTVHVGGDSDYLALFTPVNPAGPAAEPGEVLSGLNHVGLVVDDLDAAEARIKAAGYVTENHANYDPGRRFYFTADSDLEIEVVSYAKA